MKKVFYIVSVAFDAVLCLFCLFQLILGFSVLLGNPESVFLSVSRFISFVCGICLAVVLIIEKSFIKDVSKEKIRKPGEITLKIILFRTAFCILSYAGNFLSGKLTKGGVPSMMAKSLYYVGETFSYVLGLVIVCAFVAVISAKEETSENN